MKKIQKSIHPDDDLHYQKMGLAKDRVELWEDGARVDGSKGTYDTSMNKRANPSTIKSSMSIPPREEKNTASSMTVTATSTRPALWMFFPNRLERSLSSSALTVDICALKERQPLRRSRMEKSLNVSATLPFGN